EPLDGDDPARTDQRDGDRQSIVARRGSEPKPGPAVGTGDRLGVEAPVGRILVLGATALAHLEARHRRVRTVVRNPLDHGEAGRALGAVDEWVPVATVIRVPQLPQALVAGGNVGRDHGPRRPGLARLDPEGSFPPWTHHLR